MPHTGTTAVGKFNLSAIDTQNGHITVFTDGAPLRRKITVFTDVIGADNRIEGFCRPGGDNFIVITVKPKSRDEETMRKIYLAVFNALNEVLKKNPDIVDEIVRPEAKSDSAMAVFSSVGRSN